MNSTRRHIQLALGAAILMGSVVFAAPASGQWVQQYEQFYLPASHNWVFRDNYASADRLFNAFDYGHSILYEELYTHPAGPVDRLEIDRYNYITQHLLRRPPRLPLEEAAIEIAYVKLVPEAKLMFEWAHLLHRQAYDILADERLSMNQKDAAMRELLAYYRTRPDLAFSSTPKSMDLMDGQFYSLAFRQRYPKFNGLIWAYHWLQIGLYEPLLVNKDVESRTKGVNATVARFWQMLEDPPKGMPYLMPMSSGVAPAFAQRYPEAAIIFDNLHMMHDMISDILVSDRVPRSQKRAEILKAAAMLRDNTSYAIPVGDWAMMGEMMGTQNMGGVAVGFLPSLPRPTVARGMSMAGMEHGAMQHTQPPARPGEHAHMQQDSAHAGAQHPRETKQPSTPGMKHPPAQGGQHPAMPGAQHPPEQGGQHPPMPGMQHPPAQGGHEPPMPGMQHGAAKMDSTMDAQMIAMHHRMMADPVIRERIATDPVLQRMMRDMHGTMPMHGDAMPDHMHGGAGAGTPAAPAGHRTMMEFISRLLADPQVQARIRQDPELRRLWSDPAVQSHLQQIRKH